MNKKLLRDKNASGQALLLVLLLMAVVLTVVLSFVSRSVTDVAVTSREEEALRAFSAAQAGVERALIVGNVGETQIGDAKFSAEVSSGASGEPELPYHLPLVSGESGTIWFVSHDADGNIAPCDPSDPERQCFTGSSMDFCWGVTGTPDNDDDTPAVEVSIFYDPDPTNLTYSDVEIKRATFDPYDFRIVDPLNGNAFAPDSATACPISPDLAQYQFYTGSITTPADCAVGEEGCLLFANVKTIYNESAQPFGIKVSGDDPGGLPAQGVTIESSGSAGEANRKIEVFQSYGQPPDIFNAAVFSIGDLTQ